MGATVARSQEWPESILPRCEWETSSLGSDVCSLSGGDPHMLQAAIEVLSKQFRKSWFDLTRRLAVFVAPSRFHEFTTGKIQELVAALCLASGIAVVSMRATTVRTEDRKRSLDPDESFLIGERAVRFLRIESREGEEAALASLGDSPPDLAVEVEYTHYDAEKVDVYRAVGVRDLWELATGEKRRTPRILDLRAPEGARALDSSRLLPGVCADCLPAALAELRRIGGLAAFSTARALGEPVVERLFAAVGKEPLPSVEKKAQSPRPETD